MHKLLIFISTFHHKMYVTCSIPTLFYSGCFQPVPNALTTEIIHTFQCISHSTITIQHTIAASTAAVTHHIQPFKEHLRLFFLTLWICLQGIL